MKTLWAQYTPTDDTFQYFFFSMAWEGVSFLASAIIITVLSVACAINAQLAPGLGIIMIFFFPQQ